MPMYEYKCSECEHVFNAILKVDDRKLPEESCCPKCNKEGSVLMQIGTTHVVSGVGTNLKPPEGFKDVLREIKARNPHNRMDI